MKISFPNTYLPKLCLTFPFNKSNFGFAMCCLYRKIQTAYLRDLVKARKRLILESDHEILNSESSKHCVIVYNNFFGRNTSFC